MGRAGHQICKISGWTSDPQRSAGQATASLLNKAHMYAKDILIIVLCLLYEFSLLQFWTWPWWISQAWQRFLLEINPLTLRCRSEVCCFSLLPNQIAWSWQCRLQTLILPTQMLWKLQRKWILKVRSSIMWNLHAAKSNGLVTHDCFSLYLGPQ